MVKCFECGKEEPLTFKCHFCGERFCSDHRLPESHNCPLFENELERHEKAWKKGASSIKYNDDYGKNYNLRNRNNYYNPNKYGSSSKKDYGSEYNKQANTNYGKYTCPTCGKRFSHTNIECSKCWKYFCSKECAMNHGCYSKNKKESNSTKKYSDKKTSFNLQKAKSILPILFILLIFVLFFMAIEFNRTQQEFQNRILIEDVEIDVALFNEQIEKILTKIDYNGEETIEKIYIKKDNVILKEFDCTFNCSERLWLDVSNEKKFSKSDNNISEFLIEKTEIELCAKNSDLEKCYNYIIPVNKIINFNNCEDGTIHDKCSINKPLFCLDGNLSEKASVCGCPIDFRKEEEQCIEIKRCSDKTEYGYCSDTKPLFCFEGELTHYSEKCGCEGEFVNDNNMCVSKYRTGPIEKNFKYVLRGKQAIVNLTVYTGLKEHLSSQNRSTYTCYGGICPTDEELALKKVFEEQQSKELDVLVEKIKALNISNDDKVRVAVNLVQQISYSMFSGIVEKHPYEVLYDGHGVCGEKSKLLAYLLKGLNYGVVLFSFEKEKHMAVGIKCPKYDYRNSGYCFIESTRPTIMTNVPTNYVGVGELKSNPDIYKVQDGKSFDSVSEEYNDAQELERIQGMGSVLPQHIYNQWKTLTNKYGFRFD